MAHVLCEDSELGTKEYWESHYERELENFFESGDEGEIWFGRSAENRILKYLTDNIPHSSAIVDLGMGNGSLLRKLRARGYTNLCGVDYSLKAVELAKRTSSLDLDKAGESNLINYLVVDLTAGQIEPTVFNRFDVVVDKGTWDAISLNGNRAERLKNYKQAVLRMMKEFNREENSLSPRIFILFSCNFTKDELIDLFKCEQLKFEMEISALNSIEFGGKIGVTTTGCVFKLVCKCE